MRYSNQQVQIHQHHLWWFHNHKVVAAPYTRFNADLAGGGSIDGQGLVVGEMYNVALKSLSSSVSGSTIDLYR